MKRQSGFGDRKPQIWSGPYPCFDKDGKMKFVGLVFFFFLPSPVRVSKLTRWGLYNDRNVCFRRLQRFAKQLVFWQKLCNRKHERENCHLIFWPALFFLQPPPKDPPWFTDDKCHMSICAGAMVITKSLCMLKGIVCPPVRSLALRQLTAGICVALSS